MFRRLIVSALTIATALFASVSQAKNYETVFSQDFEDESTYTENVYQATFANTILGTTTSTHTNAYPIEAYNVEQWERTIYGTSDTSHFLKTHRTKQKASIELSFLVPEDAKSQISDDYKLEFDVFFSPTIGTGGKSGLSLIATDGTTLATVYLDAGSRSGTTDCHLYKGEDSTQQITTFKTTLRGISPINESARPYWTHFTLCSSQTDGVTLTAVQDNGTVVCTDVKLSDAYKTIDVIHQYSYTKAGNYDAYVSIDNVWIGNAVKPKNFVWTGVVDKLWKNAGNWTVGGLVTEFYPSDIDNAAINLENQTIIVEPDQKFGTVTAKSSTRFLVAYTALDQTFTTPVSGITVEALKPFAATNNASVYYCASRNAATFTWIVDSGEWMSVDNWRIDDLPVVVLPGRADTAYFAEKTSAEFTGYRLTMDAGREVGTMLVDDDMTMLGNVVYAAMVRGKGVITLTDGTGLHAYNELYSALVVSNDLVIAAYSDKPAYLSAMWIRSSGASSGESSFIDVYGKVSGSGSVYLRGCRSTMTLHGDWSGFSGSAIFVDDAGLAGATRYYFYFVDNCYASEHATWTIQSYYRTCLVKDNRILKFGALNGKPCSTTYNGKFEIGAEADVESVLTGGAVAKNTLHKIGSGTMTAYDITVGYYDVEEGVLMISNQAAVATGALKFSGGVLKVGSNAVDPSATIANSTSAIHFNDRGEDNVWASELALSNVGGLIKNGSGTLKLSAVPKYSGETVVSNGVLVVPFGTSLGSVYIAEGAQLHVDMSTAVPNAMVFAATSANVTLTEPYFKLINLPTGYLYERLELGNNGVLIVNGSSEYYWTGNAEDDNWSTPGNWQVEKATASRAPAGADVVHFTNGDDPVAVKIDAISYARTLDGTGALTLGGSYQLTTFLNFALSGDLVMHPNPMSETATDPDYYSSASRFGLVANNAISVNSFTGIGGITVINCDMTLNTAANETGRFIGTITAGNLVKKGAGTFNFIGEGNVSGTLKVEEGTLRLGTYLEMDNLRMDFDSTLPNTFDYLTEGSDVISTWYSHDGSYQFDYSSGQHAVDSTKYFGGLHSVRLRSGVDETDKKYSRYSLSPNNDTSGVSSKSLFLVYQPISVYGDQHIYSENTQAGFSLKTYSDDRPYWCRKDNNSTAAIFSGLEYTSVDVEKDSQYLTYWADTPFRQSKGGSGMGEYFGTAGDNNGFDGAVSEVLAFTNVLSHAEREVVTKQLLRKWNLGGEDTGAIQPMTTVMMSPGAAIDLAGQTLTAKSFIGAGAVTNGVLKVKDGVVTQQGGKLIYPAVDGTKYVVTKVGDVLYLDGAAGKSVTIEIPRTAFKAGSSGRRSIFCESKNITWKIDRTGVTPMDEGDGWWTIPGSGFTLRLR